MTATDLDITRRETESGPVVLEVGGEVDAFTAPRLREAIKEAIAAGHSRLVVHLGGVSFLDSTGLGVLVGCLKSLKDSGGSLAVVCPNERIYKVFTTTGLDGPLGVVHSEEEALTRVGGEI